MDDREQEAFLTQNDAEKRLLEHIRDLPFGEVKIIVQDGKPIRIEEIRKSIKLQE